MSTELKPCHCGSDGPFLGMQHKEGFLSLTCQKCSRSVEAFTPEGLAEGWNELTTLPIQKTTSSENVLPLLWRPVPETLPPFTDGLWSDGIWLALSDGRVARGQAMAKSPESAHPNPVHAWFIDDEQLEEAEIVAWMPFAVPDHPRLTIATTQQAAPTDRLCKTMQRPVAECGCPDCGSSLIDWPKHEANPATTYTEEPVVVPDCLRHFVEHEFSQLAVYADGRTPLYLTEEQYNAIRAMLVTAPAAQTGHRPEQAPTWGYAKTIGNLIAQLRTLDPSMPIYAPLRLADGKVALNGLTLSKEWKLGRFIQKGAEAERVAVLWTKPDDRPSQAESRIVLADLLRQATTMLADPDMTARCRLANFIEGELENNPLLQVEREEVSHG